jgi:hypothetical protein
VHVPARADEADAAFGHLWIRRDWLALRSHQQLRAVPVPLAGHARLLARTWDTLPHEDGRGMWIQQPDGSHWITIDGDGSRGEGSIPRRRHERLEVLHAGNALVRDGHGQTLRLRRRSGDDLECGDGIAVCQAGPLAVIRSEPGAVRDLLDLRDGQRRRVRRPAGMPVTEWLRHPAAQRARDDRNVMAIITLPDGEAAIIGGPFTNFATRPAWTSTGETFTFSIPFERQLAWADPATATLTRLGASTGTSVPLTDASALLGQAVT